MQTGAEGRRWIRRGDREREAGEGEVTAHSAKALRRWQDVRLRAFECLCVSQVILALAFLCEFEQERKRELWTCAKRTTKLKLLLLSGKYGCGEEELWVKRNRWSRRRGRNAQRTDNEA